MNHSAFMQNDSQTQVIEEGTFDEESVYIGVGVGAGLLFSLALLGLMAAVACLGQRRGGAARGARLQSTVTLARSDFDSYKSGSHYYVASSIHENEVIPTDDKNRKRTRAAPPWPIEHALPTSSQGDLERRRQAQLDEDDDVFTEAKIGRKYRSRSFSGGRKRKGDNFYRKNDNRRGSESSIRLPEVKTVFGGTGMTSSSSESHSLATLSLNFHKPRERMTAFEKFQETDNAKSLSS